jgi:hypothetical protein
LLFWNTMVKTTWFLPSKNLQDGMADTFTQAIVAFIYSCRRYTFSLALHFADSITRTNRRLWPGDPYILLEKANNKRKGNTTIWHLDKDMNYEETQSREKWMGMLSTGVKTANLKRSGPWSGSREEHVQRL